MVYFLYIIIIIAFLDTFSQLPIIAPFAQSLGATSILIGLIIGMYSLSNMIGNIIAGHWIDQIGRKKILVIGLFSVSLCLIGYAFVTTPEQLLGLRFLHGLGGGLLVPAAFAFLGDRSKATTRGKTMAFSGACVGTAAIIGPAFGAIVTRVYGIEWVFYCISFLFAVAAILVTIIVKETYSTKEKTQYKIDHMVKLLKKPPLLNAYLGAFTLMLSQGILAYMLPLKIAAAGHSVAYSGILMSTFGIVAILFFLLPTNKLFDRMRREKLMIYGMILITIALLILSISESLFYLFAAMILYGVGFACIFPAVTALVIDHAKENERGRAFGLFYAFFSLGVVIGSFLVGALNVVPNQGLQIGAFCMLAFALLVGLRLNSTRVSQLGDR